VLPADALKLPNDAGGSGHKVDVVPTPAQDLTLAKAERKGDTPPGTVAKAFGRVEQAVNFLYVEGVDSGGTATGGRSGRNRVAGQETPIDSFVEGRHKGAPAVRYR
jgi:hypothetical protein